MNFTMTKIAAALALTVAASSVHALPVVSMTLKDVINTDTNGAAAGAPDGLGTDGKVGAFRFSAINSDTYAGAALFYGDVNSGIINVNAANAPGSFSTGFLFTGAPFVPYTFGAISADITGGVLTISSLPWGGNFAGMVNFNLPPDAGTLQVNNLIQTGANTYAYRINWSHTITSTDDPSGAYVGFNARWYLEGTMTTVPEPETYAMMVAGLGLVGAAVRRRRKSV